MQKKYHLGLHKITTWSKTNLMLLDLIGKTRWYKIWIESQVSYKGIWIEARNWFWWYICTNSHMVYNLTLHACNCNSRLGDILHRCSYRILQQKAEGTTLHVQTTWIWDTKKRAFNMYLINLSMGWNKVLKFGTKNLTRSYRLMAGHVV